MTAKTKAMEQIKQVLHLNRKGQSIKVIVRLSGLSRNTVRTNIWRGDEADCDGSVQSTLTMWISFKGEYNCINLCIMVNEATAQPTPTDKP